MINILPIIGVVLYFIQRNRVQNKIDTYSVRIIYDGDSDRIYSWAVKQSWITILVYFLLCILWIAPELYEFVSHKIILDELLDYVSRNTFLFLIHLLFSFGLERRLDILRQKL